jgi:hypothetical protein
LGELEDRWNEKPEGVETWDKLAEIAGECCERTEPQVFCFPVSVFMACQWEKQAESKRKIHE